MTALRSETKAGVELARGAASRRLKQSQFTFTIKGPPLAPNPFDLRSWCGSSARP